MSDIADRKGRLPGLSGLPCQAVPVTVAFTSPRVALVERLSSGLAWAQGNRVDPDTRI